MASEKRWTVAGEMRCPCCGATYEVSTTPLGRREEGYFRCESCGTVVDDWIGRNAKRFRRMPRPAAAPAEIPMRLD